MPEYRFSHPVLEEIHESLRKMQQKMVFMVSFLSHFLSSTSRTIAMQDRNILPTPNLDLSLSGVQKTYEYIEPVTFRTFTELENPVIDSEGFIREKKSPHIGRSLYTQDDDSKHRREVGIIESSDIKKIQKDQKTIEASFVGISELFNLLMNEFKEQKKINAQQAAEIVALHGKLDDCRKEIADQKRTIEKQGVIIQEQGAKIAFLEQENREFRHDVDGRIRQARENFTVAAKITDPNEQTALLKKYLFEECAFQKFAASKGFHYELYKTPMSKAMRRVKRNTDFVASGILTEIYFTQFNPPVKKQIPPIGAFSGEQSASPLHQETVEVENKNAFLPIFTKRTQPDSPPALSASMKVAEFIEKTLAMLPPQQQQKGIEALLKFATKELIPLCYDTTLNMHYENNVHTLKI